MKSYYRVMLGKKSVHADACFNGNFIGVADDTGDLTGQLPEEWRSFNKKFIPIFLKAHPEKSKIAAGLV
jgi:restriction system protein